MMETIRVNMTPCDDVQTIHASQNDNEAREWGFELHNNGEKIDSSSISDQLVFKAYEGGTEQILPVNGSVPVTAPFLGDIRYPQGLLSDQEFLYRESPTEEDGLAKITDIKGNTLNWNQLVQNGNFADTSNWVENQGTISASNNVLTLTITSQSWSQNIAQPNKSVIANHKYLMAFDIQTSVITHGVMGRLYSSSVDTRMTMRTVSANTKTRIAEIITPTQSYTANMILYCCFQNSTESNGLPVGATVRYSNVMLIDLTQMGLDITDPSEFTSLFPLPYYAYNQGTLLSFNGNGIKTVGKNLLQVTLNPGSIIDSIDENGYITSKNNFPVGWQLLGSFYAMPNKQYTISATNGFANSYSRLALGLSSSLNPTSSNRDSYADTDIGTNVLDILLPSRLEKTFISNKSQLIYVWLCSDRNNTGSYPKFTFACQVEFDSATDYEPYTSSTLSLPISTYFPNGMDGFNDIHDEKNETGYAKRIGCVDMGNMVWAYDATNRRFGSSSIKGLYKYLGSRITPFKSSIYTVLSNGETFDANWNMVLYSGGSADEAILVHNHSYTDADSFKSAMSGIPLMFELKTPLENYGVVDLGSLEWGTSGTNTQDISRMMSTSLSNVISKPSSASVIANVVCVKYATVSATNTYSKTVGVSVDRDGNVLIYDPNYNTSTSAEAFKQAMQGVYLLYEKENPQGFTTASLVTENAEIPLSNEDGVLIGKCTEQLSSESGFFDAKIKLADEDGECYSNKIQLHVERSPQ